MSDVSSCNVCHEKLTAHGGGMVATQYCVMCHNPGTTDPNSGNVLTFSTMVHKIHAGQLLASVPGGEHYTDLGLPRHQARLLERRLSAGHAQLRRLPYLQQPGDAAGRQLEDGRVQAGLPDLPRQRRRLGLVRQPPGVRRA